MSPVIALAVTIAVCHIATTGGRKGISLRSRRTGESFQTRRSLWSKFRGLWSLSDPEVQALIFERHDEDFMERNTTISPAPSSPLQPTASPVVVPTASPTAIPTPAASVTPRGSLSPTGVGQTLTPSGGSQTLAPSMATTTAVPSSTGITAVPTQTGATALPTPLGNTAIPTQSGTTAAPTPLGNITSPAPTPLGSGSESPVQSASPSTGGTVVPTTSPKPSSSSAPSSISGSVAPTNAGTGSVAPTTSPAPSPSAGTVAPTPALVTTLGPTTSTGTVAPTATVTGGDETLEQFLARAWTDDGSLQQEGTPQFDALQSMLENFPDLDPNAGAEAQGQISDIYALSVLYFSTNGTAWTSRDGWPGPNDPCSGWFGITCNGESRVSAIDVQDNDLFGSIPTEIRALVSLGEFELQLMFAK